MKDIDQIYKQTIKLISVDDDWASCVITIIRQMRQLLHQNNLIRYNSVEIEAGFASISYDNLHH